MSESKPDVLAGVAAGAARPPTDCKPDGHVWSHTFGDDWTPDEGTLCDCRAVSWGQWRARGAIVLRVDERRVKDSLAAARPQPQEGLRAMVDGLSKYVEWCGGVHDDGCPEDDTCDCSGKPINDGVNAAYRFLEAFAASPPPQEPDPILEIARLSNRLQQVEEELRRVRSLFYSNLVTPSPIGVSTCTRKVGPWTVSVTSTETISLDTMKVMDENLKLVADQLALYCSLTGLDK